MRKSVHSAALVLLLCGLSACATGQAAGKASIGDRLFFGRAIPSGGNVTDAEWDAFVAEVVTPRFPDGLSIWRGQGQWRDAKGLVVREEMYSIEIFHEGTAAQENSISEIANEYKRRFRQEAVLRVTSKAAMRFY